MGGNSDAGVGGQFINAMLDGYDTSKIWKYATIVTPVAADTNMNPYPTKLFQVPYSSKPVLSSYCYWKFWKSGVDICVTEIEKTIEEEGIELVWIVLNSFNLIQIASKLSKKIEIPFVAHIWDSPEYLAKNYRLNGFTKKHLFQQFVDVMKNAARGVTVSNSMSNIFKQRYGIESKPMVFCPPKDSWRAVKSKQNNPHGINIVFAGSLYATQEWNAFLDAVAKRNKEKKVK